MEWSRDDPLSLWQRLAYGLGHVQYSLFAAMWYTYLLLFLQFVMQIPVAVAGAIFMIGQFCDGLGTPLIAYQADRIKWTWYGKRKAVHLIGTAVISLLFPFIFTMCMGCEDAPTWTLVAYFLPLVAVFQLAWASVHMSHLSLIPELTSEAKKRDELNIIRYLFEILGATAVYVIAYTILTAQEDNLGLGSTLGPQSAPIFSNMAMVLVALGIASSSIFHLATPEPRGAVERPVVDVCLSMIWKDWFRVPAFYKVAALFAVSRVITNIFQAFIPLYLQEGLLAPHYLIALVPFVIQISGFSGSALVKPVIHCVNKRSVFMVAAALTFTSATWLAWDDQNDIRAGNIYAVAALGGFGSSTMLVLALSFAADLVGDHTTSGGFVYSCLALADRVINGSTILAFQTGRSFCDGCTGYYRDVICYSVCFFTMLNLLVMIMLNGDDLNVVKSTPGSTSSSSSSESDGPTSKLLSDNKCKYGTTRKGFPLFTSSP